MLLSASMSISEPGNGFCFFPTFVRNERSNESTASPIFAMTHNQILFNSSGNSSACGAMTQPMGQKLSRVMRVSGFS